MGFGCDQEDAEGAAGHQRRGPCRFGDVLANPESSEEKREDELGDEEDLNHRQLPAVKGKRLEAKACRCGHPAEEPEGLSDQELEQLPVAMLARRTCTG